MYYELVSSTGEKVRENMDIYDINGYEKFEYTATNTGNFLLSINRFKHDRNPDSGKISISVKSLSKKEIEVRKQIKKDLEPENAKNVTTIDIDHFWNAFDHLKTCKTYADSVYIFQKDYLDKATNGMHDFIQARDWTAERFVDAILKNPDLYQSVRQNTLEAKKAVPVIEEVFTKFKEIYADFKPFKVCFAIGINNTGGTVSDRYVLIGTEVTVSGSVSSQDIIQKIKGIVAHECVHTQQHLNSDSTTIQCPLLWQSLREGSCDFIAELITGQPRNNEYGEKNESKLWTAFKNELCNESTDNWLYNGYAAKDKPGDLGYFIGYQIVKEYYKNTSDKKKAIIDIINMSDPIHFLELSKYDQKPKN
ncbi:DUF2268 domain-containing putative Zn-dependent protease [Desertivirga arenae]|uniref:gliding motility protein GldB-related protein n=1 Tax=Desertivirga arenae TaxID=2810309 RepID=UPI001A963B11